jgi:hypothetical protein
MSRLKDPATPPTADQITFSAGDNTLTIPD